MDWPMLNIYLKNNKIQIKSGNKQLKRDLNRQKAKNAVFLCFLNDKSKY